MKWYHTLIIVILVALSWAATIYFHLDFQERLKQETNQHQIATMLLNDKIDTLGKEIQVLRAFDIYMIKSFEEMRRGIGGNPAGAPAPMVDGGVLPELN